MAVRCLLLLFGIFLFTVPIQSEFVCPLPNGLFPDPDPRACFRFYQCDNNIAYDKICSSGSLFDTYKKQCVDKTREVHCGEQPITEAPVIVVDPLVAPECAPANCSLPYCFCSPNSKEIPAGLTKEQTPQMILMTFDAGINDLNHKTYSSIFLKNRTNPNGCPIRGTFFLSHQYTNYALVEDFYSKGHEIATGSVTRRAGLEDGTEEDWVGEMVSMREILKYWANVDPTSVIGMRAPHLKPGNNNQYEVLLDYDFLWDSSTTAPPDRIPTWPYTLDYAINHECKAGTCPTHSFPGVWELPMNSHYGKYLDDGGFCPYLDQCQLNYFRQDEIVNWLKTDFHRHYDNNRAPYQLTLTTNWFSTGQKLHDALLAFIDYTLTLPDVYYTTMTESLYWMTDPQPISKLTNFAAWDCAAKPERPAPCKRPSSCGLVLDPQTSEKHGIAGGTRYMVTCSSCPRKYPWVFDANGDGRTDVYQKSTAV